VPTALIEHIELDFCSATTTLSLAHCCVQGAVLAVATVLSFVLKTNPLSGFGIHGSDLYTAAFAALPIFAGSVYLENSNIKLFKVRTAHISVNEDH
jgi:hypothetical protein